MYDTYGGFTNWQTWSVCLDIDNDPDLYRTVYDRVPYTLESARETVLSLLPRGTYAMRRWNSEKGCRQFRGPLGFAFVNWSEVRDHFNELERMEEGNKP